MDYAYNGNLLEDERINLVADEIIKKYPQISFEKAKDAAMLEGMISKGKTILDEITRLYNIMLVNCDDKMIVRCVFKDFLLILKDNFMDSENNKFYFIAEEINDYLNNIREFPYISDFL